ncbi:MAG: alpha/beta hydrolase [Usitatibacter sp.]
MPTVEANGLTLAYEEHGDPAGPVMLMVMGLGVNLLFWPDELVERFAASGFRVIRFDNRDVGLSTKLDHLGTPNVALAAIKFALHLPLKARYFVEDMARDTLGFMDALGIERAHVVGASMGGMIAQNLAAADPQRVITLTSIMSTTGCRSLPQPMASARRALLTSPAKPGDVEGATLRMMKVLRAIGSRTHPADEGYLRAMCERHVRRSSHAPGVARQLVAVAGSGDRTQVVRRIKAPTLVIHGDEDPLLRPACGIATHEAIVAGGGLARLELVKGMGHDLPMPLLPRIAESIVNHCAPSS